MSLNGEEITKTCWVCFGTDDDYSEGINDWVSPCRCRGSLKWVHQACVKRWVDEKLIENNTTTVNCPQCHTDYIIIYKEVNIFIQFLNKIDHVSSYICPLLASGILVCIIYWSAVSYGAITVIQVMGEEQAITMMEDIDALVLVLLLPTIPLSLILVKTVDWGNCLQLCLRRFTPNILRNFMPSFLCEPINVVSTNNSDNSVINITTTLCAAFIIPTIATIIGKLLFNKGSYSHTRKTLLGGLIFIGVKGVLNMYQRQQNNIRVSSRTVVDYTDIDIGEIH